MCPIQFYAAANLMNWRQTVLLMDALKDTLLFPEAPWACFKLLRLNNLEISSNKGCFLYQNWDMVFRSSRQVQNQGLWIKQCELELLRMTTVTSNSWDTGVIQRMRYKAVTLSTVDSVCSWISQNCWVVIRKHVFQKWIKGKVDLRLLGSVNEVRGRKVQNLVGQRSVWQWLQKFTSRHYK